MGDDYIIPHKGKKDEDCPHTIGKDGMVIYINTSQKAKMEERVNILSQKERMGVHQ